VPAQHQVKIKSRYFSDGFDSLFHVCCKLLRRTRNFFLSVNLRASPTNKTLLFGSYKDMLPAVCPGVLDYREPSNFVVFI
jgi:hypothetical protein